MANIALGTPERDVLFKLGPPNDKYRAELARMGNEASRWVYGSHAAGGFAHVGVVVFATNQTVMQSFCPTKPQFFRPQARGIPISTNPQHTRGQLSCVIDSVEYRPYDPREQVPENVANSMTYWIHYSLVNGGTNVSDLVAFSPNIKFNLAVEVFDAKMKLVLREDYARRYLWNSFVGQEWPRIKIQPGARESEEFPIWLTDVDFGKPAPGRYFVRLLFPFEKDRFYSSNLKEFWVE